MKKVVLGLILVLLVAMAFTNPSERQHRDAVIKAFLANDKSINKKSNNEWEEFGKNLGMLLINKVVESVVYRENYFFLSLTKVSFEGKSKIVGIGAFGFVYVSDTKDIKLGN